MSSRSGSVTRLPQRPRKKNAAAAHGPPKVSLSVQDRRHKTRLLNETQRRREQLLGLTTYDVATHLHHYTAAPSTVMDKGRADDEASASRRGQRGSAEGRPSTGSIGSSGGTVAHRSSGTAPSPAGVRDSSSGSVDGTAGAAAAATAAAAERDVNTRWHTQYANHLQLKRDAAEHGQSGTATASPLLRLGEANVETAPPPPRTYEEWLATGCQTGPWSVLLEEEVYAPAAAEKALLAAKYNPKGRAPQVQA